MPQRKEDKEIKRGELPNILYQMIWQNFRVLFRSHLEEITCISSMQGKLNGSSAMIPVNFPNALSYKGAK